MFTSLWIFHLALRLHSYWHIYFARTYVRSVCTCIFRCELRVVGPKIIRRNVNCVWFFVCVLVRNLHLFLSFTYSLPFVYPSLFLFISLLCSTVDCALLFSSSNDVYISPCVRTECKCVCVFLHIASKCHFITVLFRLSLMFVCIFFFYLTNQSSQVTIYDGMNIKFIHQFWFITFVEIFLTNTSKCA